MRQSIAALPIALGLASALTGTPTPHRRGHDHVRREEIAREESADRVPAPIVGGAPYGDPIPTRGHPAWTMLAREGHRLAYDEGRRNPAWVTYTYSFRPTLHTGHTRLGFSTDTQTKAQVTEDDYTKTGFSRGHMAPSFGIFTYFGRDAQRQAYLMSNIVPQMQPLNAGPWEETEDRSANAWVTSTSGPLWTIDGPVYGTDAKTFSSKRVFVPEATFKILVRYDHAAEQPELMAFLMPQTAKQKDAAVEYLASINEIEERTGLDFLSRLPDDLEEKFEAVRRTTLWK